MTFEESVNRALSAFAQRLELAGSRRARSLSVAPFGEGRRLRVEARDAGGVLTAGAVYDHAAARLVRDDAATAAEFGDLSA